MFTYFFQSSFQQTLVKQINLRGLSPIKLSINSEGHVLVTGILHQFRGSLSGKYQVKIIKLVIDSEARLEDVHFYETSRVQTGVKKTKVKFRQRNFVLKFCLCLL